MPPSSSPGFPGPAEGLVHDTCVTITLGTSPGCQIHPRKAGAMRVERMQLDAQLTFCRIFQTFW